MGRLLASRATASAEQQSRATANWHQIMHKVWTISDKEQGLSSEYWPETVTVTVPLIGAIEFRGMKVPLPFGSISEADLFNI